MDHLAIKNDRCAETEIGENSFLERTIFHISIALSTRVPGVEKVHKQTKQKTQI